MPERPFRFLHAADLHVDRPLEGLAEVPEHLVDLLIDGPLRSAARVFDVAIDRHVDFVVLAGDVIDWNLAAPRETLFLTEQFERLADRNIDVYWATATSDAPSAHAPSAWPRNVRIFPAGRVGRFRHETAGATVCELLGRSHAPDAPARPFDFAPSDGGLFSLAVAHVDWNCGPLGEIGTRYWALGGRHERGTPLDSHSVVHYAGTPQGRSPGESGPHGCTLIEVDGSGRVQLTVQSCDVVRFCSPALSAPEDAGREELRRLVSERTRQLLDEAGGVVSLISWKVTAAGSALQNASLAAELLAQLRAELADPSPPAWIVDLQILPPDQLPDRWYDEESIRGDYLRAIRAIAADDSKASSDSDPPLIVPDDVSAGCLQGLGWPALSLEQSEARRRVVREAAWLGADLLSPGEQAP